MNNRRKSTRSIGIAPVIPWVCLVALLVAYGLVLVNLAHRSIQLGQECTKKEERLEKLIQENESAAAHIATLTSPRELKRRLIANNSSMVKIPEDRIVWLMPARSGEEGIRAVSLLHRER